MKKAILISASALAVLAIAGLALAQSNSFVPRVNAPGPGGQAYSAISVAAPTKNPWPETNVTSTWSGYTGVTWGQSASVPGALHLAGCSSYQVTAIGDGGTLQGTGTGTCYYWPETPQDAGTSNLWTPCSTAFNETVTLTAQNQTFNGHQATGFGWIDIIPTNISVSGGGTPNIKIEASCAY